MEMGRMRALWLESKFGLLVVQVMDVYLTG